jgi:hypothetical protein
LAACLAWGFDDGGNPYAGGALYSSLDSGANWAPTNDSANNDAAFRTYVTVPAPPTPVASNLPNAAMDTSTDTSPLLALGFAALLLGSLGTLAFANTRRR